MLLTACSKDKPLADGGLCAYCRTDTVQQRAKLIPPLFKRRDFLSRGD